ncbi:MAG: T9SS type A sorting domain-containing protein [Paludibacter sp.]|nr:T9SS type A sorting domain-containing protein [Paludibacter sp.]
MKTHNIIVSLVASLIISMNCFADVVVQAESGTFVGKTDTQHAGYTGSSFVDLTNAVGSTLLLEFTLAEDMPAATVKVRWANGKSDDRAMSFTVNGTLQVASQAFGSSGAYTTWLETSVTLNLRNGTNQVLLTSLTANGGPNLDKITIVGASEGTKEFALNVSIQGKGTVIRTPDAPFYAKGSTVQLQAVPDPASQSTFLGWTGDVNGSSLITSIIVDTIKNVTASFKSAIHASIYCAPVEKGGSDTNTGSISSPVFTVDKALAMAEPGDTIFMRGGTYRYSATVFMTKNGNPQGYYNIFNYPGEKPVLNFYDIFSSYTVVDATARGEARGFKITGNYYYLKGLEICQAPDNGIKIEGSYNICEQLVLHHNGDGGIQIGLAKDVADAVDKVCYNVIKNCDAYRNLDWGTSYENADGFSCKLSPGANNRFVGCRAWENADDGWDFYMTHYTIYVDSCWAMGNGNPDLIVTNDPDWEYGQKNTPPSTWNGDGNGFKLGGDGWAAKHQVRNCVSFDGYSTGACYSENNNADSLFIFNCVGWQGLKNFRVRAYPSDLRNNISFDAKVGGEAQMFDLAAGTTEKNNSWNNINGAAALVPYKTATGSSFDQKTIYNQFVSTSKADFLAPRETDGSLPKNGFGRLKPNSIFIDKGSNVVRGMNPATLKSFDISLTGFYGAAVDMGAYEFVPTTGLKTIQSAAKNLKAYPNPFMQATTFDIEAVENGNAQLQITDLTGKAIVAVNIGDLMIGEKRTIRFNNDIKAGIYVVDFINGNYRQSLKLVKMN